MTKRILVIDDDEDIQDVARIALEVVGGWQVITASSGSEGLLLAVREQPNAILLDVMMPDLDGIATLKQLKANPLTQPIPVIFLTAKVQSRDRDRFAQLDIIGIIAKPFKTMILADRVAEILGWKD
ncbi:Two-component system response regulator [Hyella patelloides LEGE 07179]|uniref:Two-component system response regulator n=1 Tax=Hyella patelloides LEGE 07179 TaxID=945734 RepID=A0A563W011_9CYAN|nr:response regulator [Hyella patelloides]VEP17016.1 Two-component system response regulator [Hyella patelloides LEGE 07179]